MRRHHRTMSWIVARQHFAVMQPAADGERVLPATRSRTAGWWAVPRVRDTSRAGCLRTARRAAAEHAASARGTAAGRRSTAPSSSPPGCARAASTTATSSRSAAQRRTGCPIGRRRSTRSARERRAATQPCYRGTARPLAEMRPMARSLRARPPAALDGGGALHWSHAPQKKNRDPVSRVPLRASPALRLSGDAASHARAAAASAA